MPITDLLERNSKLYGDEIALVEINPEVQETQRVTWKEYALIQPTSTAPYRREITWSVFDEKANRVANLLLGRGVHKGQKVAILLMNCLEWLPIYFGILKAGAVAVPLNFRYTAQEIDYCLKKADVDVLFFGSEFIGRVEDIVPKISSQMLLFFVGDTCPSFAEDYHRATANCSSAAPKVLVDDEDDAAIYYSSGTTGFPKAILLKHQALLQSARMEAIHHETKHEDVFLCIPPLYHTGAKMHWFGSLFTGSRAVLLKGNSPQAIFDAVSGEKCTIVWLLVPWCQDILASLDRGELKLEDFFTPNYLYDFFSDLHQVPDQMRKQRKQALFTRFGIDQFAEVKVADLSTGMKQKVSLVISIVHDPDIIIFDEPTNGLDVITAKVVTDFLQELRTQGKTVLVSTHIFSLVEKLCDRVGVIIDGTMALCGTLDDVCQGQNLEDRFFQLYVERKGEGA